MADRACGTEKTTFVSPVFDRGVSNKKACAGLQPHFHVFLVLAEHRSYARPTKAWR